MRIDVLTIFPEMFPPVLGASIVKRAIAKGLVRVEVHDLRDWSRDKHKKVDDRPYGGGPGMVMRPEPFFEAVDDLKIRFKTARSFPPSMSLEGKLQRESRKRFDPRFREDDISPHIILLSPQGKKLTQAKAEELSKRPWLVLLCGHYEGVDDRVRAGLADEEISIGDYVLTCGELPAMVLIDSLVRLLPGCLGDERSSKEESFRDNLLEYPQFTRPVEIRGMRVPEILRSGDHVRIGKWRRLNALRRTFSQRPDLNDESSNSND